MAAHGTGGRVAVVGGGLAGSMAAILLAGEGWEVDLYERHGDLRREEVPGPSMNLGLSRRGLEALRRVDLHREVLDHAIPMQGRVVHRLRGEPVFQPYGGRRDQVIHAVKRRDIQVALLDRLDRLDRVRLHFHHRLVDLDKATGELRFEGRGGGTASPPAADFVVGADGVFSLVRRRMQHGERADYGQRFLDWGWKELTVPAGADGRPSLAGGAFHLWPRGGSMVFAHPNRDGTFTCSLVMPHGGAEGFAAISGNGRLDAFFSERFPDLSAAIPDLGEQFRRNPVVDLVSVRTSPWSHGDRVVLLGDAAHAVVPFMAQGMNAAFEDALHLVECLRRHPGRRAAAFAAFEAERKPHTDALADMSEANFVELRDRVRSPLLRIHRALDTLLSRALGEAWMPLHARVTHTLEPYAAARRRARRQDRIVTAAAAGLAAGAAALVWRRRRSRPVSRPH